VQLVGGLVPNELTTALEELPQLIGKADVIDQKSNREMFLINQEFPWFGLSRTPGHQSGQQKWGGE